jgi:hypothetical protein
MLNKEHLQNALGLQFPITERRPGLFQINAPFYYEDGDMVELFVQATNDGRIRFCDEGLTYFKLSYDTELTEARERIIQQILTKNQVSEDEGSLQLETDLESILPQLFHYGQTLAKVSSVRYHKRELQASLFYEQITEAVLGIVTGFEGVETNYYPTKHKDVAVDVAILTAKQPIYLFTLREGDTNKATEIGVACFEYKADQMPHHSIVLHENFDALPNKHRNRIIRATDKQFADQSQFIKEGATYIERQIA